MAASIFRYFRADPAERVFLIWRDSATELQRKSLCGPYPAPIRTQIWLRRLFFCPSFLFMLRDVNSSNLRIASYGRRCLLLLTHRVARLRLADLFLSVYRTWNSSPFGLLTYVEFGLRPHSSSSSLHSLRPCEFTSTRYARLVHFFSFRTPFSSRRREQSSDALAVLRTPRVARTLRARGNLTSLRARDSPPRRIGCRWGSSTSLSPSYPWRSKKFTRPVWPPKLLFSISTCRCRARA